MLMREKKRIKNLQTIVERLRMENKTMKEALDFQKKKQALLEKELQECIDEYKKLIEDTQKVKAKYKEKSDDFKKLKIEYKKKMNMVIKSIKRDFDVK